ncbi:MAG: hypothetical protein EOP14_05985 [Pseudomonas sp.]|nr:MAG: hypothetical protein EOP14_05985 [Pseudomonas sp.]
MHQTSDYLTPIEQEKFDLARKNFLLAAAIAMTFCLLLLLATHLVDLNNHLWIVVPGIFIVTINVIVRPNLRCSACAAKRRLTPQVS